jgi:hypothetical protein
MKIEKNVPMPNPRRSYEWAHMGVNDSVFFKDEPKASQSNPVVAAMVWGKRNNAKFSSSKEGNGVRIWRVA